MPNHFDSALVNQFIVKNSIKAIIFISFKISKALAGKSSFHKVMNTKNYRTFTSPHIYLRPEDNRMFITKFVLPKIVNDVAAEEYKN